MPSLTENQMNALGLSDTHIAQAGPYSSIANQKVEDSLNELVRAAAGEGFNLTIASGFRNFERQLKIFNAKARGERPVFDLSGSCQIDLAQLSEVERVRAIMRWSALPGASRHHWGTDFDVYDAAVVDSDYAVQLTPEEAVKIFGQLHNWLDGALEKFGFFRPYRLDRGGIAPERWHISHRELATEYEREITPELLLQQIQQTDIELAQTIGDNIAQLFQRYVAVND